MRDNPISLKQAVYRASLATSLFTFILEKSKGECSIDLNNLIALARDINQEVQHALLKHSPKPLMLKLLSYAMHKQSIPLDQAMYRAGLGISLFNIILDQTSNNCSTELHDLISLACDINQEVYHALQAAVYEE
ncbi:hypothetical protein [Xenorhabdus bovienii]|uniref:Uncharacterized protein n=1 Tax=Xenorhabdus bovienii str. oregonense TaxID=1398202 RepID=A0A077P950_XENBV|nr:hypothetical protein [Xenorhabdus bovienii]MDE1475324.1 hypothetical protein [Xenorhabdus bovienii]MDE9553279.1 hypothetical protein [Xenorhabdus bovienii]CDH06206.1 conserved hypothetical protein [Xenorhabdus bovienii str. oregonense]